MQSYQVDPLTHRLEGARQLESPNCNERPTEEISLLVIHNISLPPGQFATGCVEQFFCNQLDWNADPFFAEIKGLQVSAHLYIDRQGQVTQFVPFSKRAWHAGVSSFNGRSNCNDYSIGIELEGTDDHPYTEAQYRALSEVSHALMRAYPELASERVVGHRDIAPERKTDPGAAFDWQRYRNDLDL